MKESQRNENHKWYADKYRRILLDMHVEDWDSSFLSQFDPKAYAEELACANIQAATIPAISHLGYSFWPSTSGRMHAALRGRDMLGELIGCLKSKGIDVTLDYSCVYNNWAYENQPSWRIIDMEGKSSRERPIRSILTGRYGVCCPNSAGYRSFVAGQLRDLAGRYDINGFFLDMMFWPNVCYCPSCTERYAREVGGRMPMTIDWTDDSWNRLQAVREEWIRDFLAFAVGVLKEKRPSLTVTHQSSLLIHPWICGVTDRLQGLSDFCAGDFAGDFFQQSFICKLMNNLSADHPFEFHTTRSFPSYMDGTTIKTTDMLEMHASITMAHGGAILFADPLDPLGRFDRPFYASVGRAYGRAKVFEPFLGGELIQETAVFFSSASKMDFGDCGKVILQGTASMPHLNAAFGAARTLKSNHVPYGVVTGKNLPSCGGLKVLILPEVFFLYQEEKSLIRDYVMKGGSLYASGPRICGLLPDVFGVTCSGETKENVTYIAPSEKGAALFPSLDALHPLSIFSRLPLASAEPGSDVLATVTLPYTDPRRTDRFSLIHSDPPGIPTSNPAVIMRRMGRGRAFWISYPLEKADQPSHKRCFFDIIRVLAGGPFCLETEAPPAVELILFRRPEENRFIVHVLNMQEELPPVLAVGMTARIAATDWRPKAVYSLPDRKRLRSAHRNGWLEFELPPTRLYSMAGIEYR